MSSFEDARRIFLGGCDLPRAWAGEPLWRILDTRFGCGLNFLAAWRAWQDDPARPRILHVVAAEPLPVRSGEILRHARDHSDLMPLALELAARWFGLTPGAHRLSFENGRVLLTVHVRGAADMLRSEPVIADSVFLHGFDADDATLKAVARHCRRGTRIALPTTDRQVGAALDACGFQLHGTLFTHGIFDPHWEPRGAPPPSVAPSRCIVIGSGLAGSAAASSLARRGWDVTVLDAGETPAAGASGLPVGLLAPQTSPDDNLLSRLSRAGVRQTMQAARDLLIEGIDWQPGVTVEVRTASEAARFPQEGGYEPWQAAATTGDGRPAVLHAHSAWLKPAALARAWLAQPRITWRGRSRVERIERQADEWSVVMAGGGQERAPLVVIAAALGSRSLAPLTLHAVRGQIAWGFHDETSPGAAHPFNGNGHYIPGVPVESRRAWYCGSTYGRGDEDSAIRAADTQTNLDRLSVLLPEVAATLRPEHVRAWAGVRCTSSDRRPLVGELAPGLFITTAMGSRGLTFSLLAAELLTARLHAEPLPIEERLARALDVGRTCGGKPSP